MWRDRHCKKPVAVAGIGDAGPYPRECVNCAGITDPGYSLFSRAKVFVERPEEIEILPDVPRKQKAVTPVRSLATAVDRLPAQIRSQDARAAI